MPSPVRGLRTLSFLGCPWELVQEVEESICKAGRGVSARSEGVLQFMAET